MTISKTITIDGAITTPAACEAAYLDHAKGRLTIDQFADQQEITEDHARAMVDAGERIYNGVE